MQNKFLRFLNLFLIIAINFSLFNLKADTTPLHPTSIFVPRSQGANTARELVGWQEFIYKDTCNFYVTTDLAFEYQQTFKDQRIAKYIFGSNKLTFMGSQVPNQFTGTDFCYTTTTNRSCANLCCPLIADYFGLPTDYKQTINICPSIENIIWDFEMFMGLDKITKGLYFRLHAPLTISRWTLFNSKELASCCEQSANLAVDQFPECYMSEAATNSVGTLADALCGKTFGDMKTPWAYGKFSQCTRSLTRVADVDLILGYNIWQGEDYHAGLYLQTVVPTGNLPNPEFIFSPIVGNGKHWEFGLGLTGHTLLWQKGTEQRLLIYAEGNITHLFANTQKRSFDFLNNCFFSRYMLLKEFDSSGNYIGNLINAINFATREAQVDVKVKADFSAKLSYYHCDFGFDFGFNIYGNTQEHVCIKNYTNSLDERFFGFKGTQGVCAIQYNEVSGNLGGLTGQTPEINSTESNATISSPGSIDNPVNISGPVGTVDVTWDNTATTGSPISSATIALDSQPPVLISVKDLNPKSAESQSILTYKMFFNFCHTWHAVRFMPQLGIGGEVEFNGKSKEQKYADQWGIWLKGGLAF